MSRTEYNQKIETLRDQFMSGTISDPDVEYYLKQLGNSTDRTRQLIRQWEDDRTMAAYTLS